MLANFRFGSKWISWIKECVSTARISILVNGSPTKEFNPQKGLRQGDPLSPFLFNLVVEALNIFLQRARELSLLKGVIIGNNQVQLSHLPFADDSFLFCEAELSEVLSLKRILRCFEVASRLKINYHKSMVCGVGFSDSALEEFVSLRNCKTLSLPLKYLGLPLGANPRRKRMWKPVIEKFKLRLAGWKMRLPEGIAKEIDKIQASFLWGGSDLKRKIHLVKCGGGGLLLTMIPYKIGSYRVNTIFKEGIKFWYDHWCGAFCLKDAFLRLFQLSNDKEGSLKDFVAVSVDNWFLTFRRPLFEWENEELLKLLGTLAAALSLNLDVQDNAVWLASKPGQSLVSTLYNHTNLGFGNTAATVVGVSLGGSWFCRGSAAMVDRLSLAFSCCVSVVVLSSLDIFDWFLSNPILG
ncbi:uncharacterized protein LOC114295410 [Camellia sinensis]|uniref:uncharacterized protein LOC114295410 n=1 Tax=Camellia sinensis TaxID=4442 RepID=UPI001035A1E8|nr:uncharacterized protein LOC114295410 [Camellia sinensis]